MQDDLPAMRIRTMLEKVDALPGAEQQTAVSDRDREVRLGKRRPNVCRHIVGAFGAMAVAGIARRSQPPKEVQKIGEHIGVRILLDQQRRGRVPQKDRQKTRSYRLPTHPLLDGSGDVVQPLRRGLELQPFLYLPHFVHLLPANRFSSNGHKHIR